MDTIVLRNGIMTGPGEKSTESSEAGGDKEVKLMESLVLSMMHWWTIQGIDSNQVKDMMEKRFNQDQIFNAHWKLTGVKPTHHNGGARGTAGRMQAEGLFKLYDQLTKEGNLPRFSVSSEDLNRVASLLNTVSIRDEMADHEENARYDWEK